MNSVIISEIMDESDWYQNDGIILCRKGIAVEPLATAPSGEQLNRTP